ncbi:hypothetical protein VE04_03527 [Pseudogymnoascus sp. 24MN13]|nr:hypothetical protein VE04_03527 [Pseudogymnoascus sp. 24MN13]
MGLEKTLLSLLVILDTTVAARNEDANWNGDRLKRRRALCIDVTKKSSMLNWRREISSNIYETEGIKFLVLTLKHTVHRFL